MPNGSDVELLGDQQGHHSGVEYHAIADQIIQKASAEVAQGKAIEGAIDADLKREAGATEENRRSSSPENRASAEAEVGVAMVENAVLPAAAKVIKTGLDTLSDARTSASKFTGKEAKGLGAGINARSIDADFTTMKKSSNSIATGSGIESATRGRCLLTKANCVAKNLGEQHETNVGTRATEQNSANLNTARTQVQTLGIANEKALAQGLAQKAKYAHTMGQPTPDGGKAPQFKHDHVSHPTPPNFDKKDDGEESMMG